MTMGSSASQGGIMADIDIRLGDAYEGIKTLPNRSVDLIITDPPYDFGGWNGGGCANVDRLKKDLPGRKFAKGSTRLS